MFSQRPHFETNSIVGGNNSDNDVEPIDPINEIIKLRSGISSAIITESEKKIKLLINKKKTEIRFNRMFTYT